MDEMDRLADLKRALHPTDGPTERLRARALAADDNVVRPTEWTRAGWARGGLVAAFVAALAVGALVLAAGTTGPGGTADSVQVRPAGFALHVNADGSVTFTAEEVVDVAAATEALNDAGISGRVVREFTAGCGTTQYDLQPADLYPDESLRRGFEADNTVTVRTSDYPPGGGLLLIVGVETNGGRPSLPARTVQIIILAFDNATDVPTCLNIVGDPTGPPAEK